MDFRNLLLAGLLTMSGTFSVDAQIIHVRYSNQGSYSGASPVPGSSPTDFWNVFGSDPFARLPLTAAGLFNTAQNVTSVGYAELTAGTGEFFLGGLPNEGGIPVFTDYAHRGDGGGAMTFTLSGLVPNAAYDLYVYAGRNLPTQDTASITVGSTTLTTSFSGVQSAYIEGTNYVHFSNLTATPSGTLQFVSDSGILNGFSVVAVPEPSVVALVGLAGTVVVLLRRRR